MKAITQANATAQTARGWRRIDGGRESASAWDGLVVVVVTA
jgi:hypothetical protein